MVDVVQSSEAVLLESNNIISSPNVGVPHQW